MRFGVLGPFEVVDGKRDTTPGAPKMQQVLALLLLRLNHVVPTSDLVDELWGQEPPNSAMTTLQSYIYRLRQLIRDDPSISISTRAHGYALTAPRGDSDLIDFERLAAEGRKALDHGEPERAAPILAEALRLWRGPALSGMTTGELLQAQVTRLEESRLHALERRLEADLALGRHQELVSELKALSSKWPMHEGFHAKLMVALDGAGRRVEALEVYQQVRQVLVEELGLEPSPMLRRLHQTLLSDDRPPAPAGRSAVQLAERGAGPPAQLPACIADFSGRKEAVSRVVRRLSPGGTRRPALPVISITGMPGSGKTALALWAAHAVRRYFPDGQFFVGLGGSQDAPVHPWQVIGQFLRAGGVADEQIPEPMDERTTFFRSWSADRSILVVLDDAASDEQVTPLVPAGEESAVIVTGQAPGFADGEIVLLDVFEPEESLELLRRVLGRGRVDRERRAAERIARMCGHLPLALRAAATRLAMMPEWPLAEFAGRLSLSGSRLDELRVGRLDVRSHLAAGYRRLCEQERSLLCLLSGIAQAEFLAPDAAALTGLGLAALEAMLGRLAERRLVHVGYGPGGTPRYSLHELVRAYAREQPAGLSGPTGALTA